MEQDNDFLRLINEAFVSEQEQVRRQAHEQLLKVAAERPALVAGHCTACVRNAALGASTRVRVATFLGGVLLPKPEENRASIWTGLQAAEKDDIKAACLQLLGDQNAAVMRAAASLSAVAFALDCVTDKSWDNLLPALTNNVENTEVRIQQAAMTCLGFICDVLNKHKITSLADARVDALLTGICKGLRGYKELTETAVQALEDSLQFLQKKIDNERIADFVMELLITLLREVRAAPAARGSAEADRRAETTRKLVYCLARITKMLFARLGKYHQVLFEAVQECFAVEDAGVFVACCSYFAGVAKQEERARTAYLGEAWRKVMDACLRRLTAPGEAEEEEGAAASPTLAVLDTMTVLNRLYYQQTAEPIHSFVTTYIEMPEDEKRIAALIAYESMLEMPKSPPLVAFINSGFYGILSFLQSGSAPIRRAAARFLLHTIRGLPEVFFSDVNFHKATKILFAIMEGEAADEAAVALQHSAALMYTELAQAARASPSSALLLRSVADPLFDVVCRVTLRCKNLSVIDAYFSAVFDFLQRVVEPKLLGDYAVSFAKYIAKLRGQQHPHHLSIYEFIFINLTVIITQVRKHNARFFAGGGQNAGAFLQELYQSVLGVFHEVRHVVSEGLMLMATILAHDTGWSAALVPAFLKEYVTPALHDYANTDLFKAAVDAVSVCCKAFEAELEPFVANVYSYFLGLLGQDTVQKELKLTIFFALSDFVLHCPAASRAHLDALLALAELALQAVVVFQGSAQDDLVEYAEAFKETLVDFYLCVVHGLYLRGPDDDARIEASLNKVIQFIKLTSGESLNPTINYQSNCLGLLVDFYCKKKAPAMIDVPLVNALYKSLQKHASYGDVNGTLEYAKKHFASL